MDVVTSQPSAMSEVALAAADSSYPVAGIEYLIGAVHSFTGLNWYGIFRHHDNFVSSLFDAQCGSLLRINE